MIKILLAFFILLASCSAARTGETGDKTGKESCSLLVSFYSIGSGTNTEAGEALKKFMTGNEELKEVTVDTIPWGREGEVDFCFRMEKLAPGKKTQITQRIEELLKGAENVRVEPDTPSPHRKQ